MNTTLVVGPMVFESRYIRGFPLIMAGVTIVSLALIVVYSIF